jgi:alanyl-tRNA synthetase
MSKHPTSANELRKAFSGYFADRGHTVVPSASLIPHDPTILFTVAGMVPFKPFFTGDEVAPYPRAVSVQKCARAGGKHNDLDDVGRTKRHLVFFEMLGNFSFGDYFKEDSIKWSWDLVTEVFGLDGDKLWITVHESDDEAEQIWRDTVGVRSDRIQRLGDKDNFWQMGETGPCGPCSEIHIDRGAAFGPDGGPLNDPHGDRFLEFWNLVFMQYNQAKDGSRERLPKPSIDTGAGLERILTLLQGVDSVWESDVLAPLVDRAASLTGSLYRPGAYDDRSSFSLRVLAEHARSSTMLVNDGVFPSNENRGYVLRRIIRRAVRHAYLLGTEKLVMPSLVETAIDVMGEAYPDLRTNHDFILEVLTKEEERFRHTLTTGMGILEHEMESAGSQGLSGKTAFLLHDTYGFPLELTSEIAGERGVGVDLAGFESEMTEQRERAKAARKSGVVDEKSQTLYRALVEKLGATIFVGYTTTEASGKVVAVHEHAADPDLLEVFLDSTPFYAESGGQVGDTGHLVTDSGALVVIDTTFALPGLRMHLCKPDRGVVTVGQVATASVDSNRRQAIRRNHTGTHILHWALREVLGDHVKQAGSLVDDQRLRFDFSHYSAVTPEEIAAIERLANTEVLKNVSVEAFETAKDEALEMGAMAFFGDKYGDTVRVLRAGSSIELCGGTHASATGDIGTIKIISESSIGSNLRRVEAVTGDNTIALLQRQESELRQLGEMLGSSSANLFEALERKLAEVRSLQEELKSFRARAVAQQASVIAAGANGGLVIERIDDLAPGDLKDLAVAVRQVAGVKGVFIGGVAATGGVSLVCAVDSKSGVSAGEVIKACAQIVGGGGGGKGDVATAGGKDVTKIDEALETAREKLAPLSS